MTSRDVVNVVQRRLRSSPETRKVKVGHCGTLDPLAEGVLVLGVGPAVRLVPYVQQQSKRYCGRFLLGQESPTGDLEFEPTRHEHLPIPTRGELQRFSETLIGQIQQIPPAYSAIWVDGQRAYDRVRRGEEVAMPSRTVTIDALQILKYNFPELELDIVCGSGTYIRTLGMDLAKGVGSCAVMSSLQRTSVGPFRVDDAVSMEQLRDESLTCLLKPASLGVEHLPKLLLDESLSQEIRFGRCIEGDGSANGGLDTEVAAMMPGGELCAILRWKRDRWCPYRVF